MQARVCFILVATLLSVSTVSGAIASGSAEFPTFHQWAIIVHPEAVTPPVAVAEEPLQRPQPLTSITIANPTNLFQAVTRLVTNSGFGMLPGTSPTDGQLVARKFDGPQSENHDDIIIWFERDYRDPSKLIKIYLLFGRFESNPLIHAGAAVRVPTTALLEKQHVGDLESSITHLAVSARWDQWGLISFGRSLP